MEETFNYVAEDQLQGLLMPPDAAGFNAELWLGLLLIVCLLGFVFWRWKKHQNTPLVIAQKKLHALEKLQAKTPQASQNLALQLARLLCQGLGVKRLDQYQPENIQDWDTFHNTLNSVCYSTKNSKKWGGCTSLRQTQDKPSPLSINTSSDLLTEAKHWLRQ